MCVNLKNTYDREMMVMEPNVCDAELGVVTGPYCNQTDNQFAKKYNRDNERFLSLYTRCIDKGFGSECSHLCNTGKNQFFKLSLKLFIDGCNNRKAAEPTVSVEVVVSPEIVEPEIEREVEVVEVDIVEVIPVAERETDSHAIQAIMSSILTLMLLTC